MVLQLTIGSGCRSDTLNLFSVNATGAWLVRQQYLRVNPFGGLPAAPAVQLGITGCTLTRAQWQYVLQTALRRHSAFKPAFHPRVLGSRTRDERGRARRGDHRHAHMHRARRRTGRRVELAGDGEGPARAPYRCRGTGSTRCASSCARARCRSARHPADCASRDRRGAAPDVVGRLFKATFARAAELLAITNPNVAADLRRASALVAPHLCESRSGRRRRHPRHGGIARPRESGYNHAPDQGGRDAPVPVGRDVFQRGARRCQFCTNVDCVDSSRAACRVELGAKCRRDRSCPQYGADGSRSCVAEGRAEARR